MDAPQTRDRAGGRPRPGRRARTGRAGHRRDPRPPHQRLPERVHGAVARHAAGCSGRALARRGARAAVDARASGTARPRGDPRRSRSPTRRRGARWSGPACSPRWPSQLKPRLVEGLTPTGLERLDQIPLIGAMEGVAMGAVTLRGPVNAVAFSPNAQLLVAGWGVRARGMDAAHPRPPAGDQDGRRPPSRDARGLLARRPRDPRGDRRELRVLRPARPRTAHRPRRSGSARGGHRARRLRGVRLRRPPARSAVRLAHGRGHRAGCGRDRRRGPRRDRARLARGGRRGAGPDRRRRRRHQPCAERGRRGARHPRGRRVGRVGCRLGPADIGGRHGRGGGDRAQPGWAAAGHRRLWRAARRAKRPT